MPLTGFPLPTNAPGATSAASFLTVNVLGKAGFDYRSTLGSGCYAKVKKFWDKEDGRMVAIKVIDKKKVRQDFLVRFLPRELDILPRLRHPNIIQVFKILSCRNLYFIVEELAAHGDLLERIKGQRRLTEREARPLFRQLAEALHYLHDSHVIHRDLKCENVLLDKHDNVKLTDFGFARYMRAGDLSTTFCGSTAYAAPEILQGRPYRGYGSDIWSLGVVLYIMVTGLMPYDDRNVRRMMEKQNGHIIHYHASVAQKVGSQCKNLIRDILHPDPRFRASFDRIISSDWLRNTPYVVKSDEGAKDKQTTTTEEGEGGGRRGAVRRAATTEEAQRILEERRRRESYSTTEEDGTGTESGEPEQESVALLRSTASH